MNQNNSQDNKNKPKFKDIEIAISRGRLLQAVDLAIEVMGPNLSDSDRNMLDGLRQSYSYMLEYALTGNEDPGRRLLIDDVRCDLRGLMAEYRMDRRMAASSSTLPSLRRLDKIQKTSLSVMLDQYRASQGMLMLSEESGQNDSSLHSESERIENMIFEKILALDFSDRNSLRLIKRVLSDGDILFSLKALIIAAIYLTFSYYFSRHKFLLLLDLLDSTDDERLKARVMTTVFLILLQWHDEAKTDLRVADRLEEWNGSLLNYTMLRDVVKVFLRSLDTARISEKMRRDFMPDMNSMNGDIMKSLREKLKKGEVIDPEMNPEWEELMRKTGMDKKLKEFQELQDEGADLLMLPLSQIKQINPFFNRLSNWFLPFSIDNSSLSSVHGLGDSALDLIFSDNSTMCHSDRYSLCLMLGHIPEAQRKMMFDNLQSGMESMKSDMADRLLKVSSPKFQMELECYMRDLYRFYSLYRNRSDFFNPFSSRVEFLNIDILKSWLEESEMKEFLSEFFFKRGYYKEALRIFNLIVEKDDVSDGYTWQKIGYCCQQTGDLSGALDAYSRAELFLGVDMWQTRMQAKCHEGLGHYSEAMRLYRVVFDERSQNRSLLRRLAICAFSCSEEEEILPLLYKYDYENPSTIDDLLIVAEVLCGKMTEASSRIDSYMLAREQTPEVLANLKMFRILAAIENGNLKEVVGLMPAYDSDSETNTLNSLFADWGLQVRYYEVLHLLEEASYSRRNMK